MSKKIVSDDALNIKMNHFSNNAKHKLQAWARMFLENHGQHLVCSDLLLSPWPMRGEETG